MAHTWAESTERTEPPEQAYRRGYRDGWVLAMDDAFDLMFKAGLSRADAYRVLWDWGIYGALARWVAAGSEPGASANDRAPRPTQAEAKALAEEFRSK